jgi:hypothetical protein
MEYKPKFGQPFTLQEASALDVGIISEGWTLLLLSIVTRFEKPPITQR